MSIAVIVGLHGVHGEVKVLPLTDVPERLKNTGQVFLDDTEQTRRVQSARPHQRVWLVKFEGVDDRESARRLKGKYMTIDEADVLPLPDDKFYEYQLLDCQVVNLDGHIIGNVSRVITGPANDLLEILTPSHTTAFVPFVKQFVKRVDLDARKIVISPIPGLLGEESQQ